MNASEPPSIWMRPEPANRRTARAQRTLSRAQIVRAAVEIADAEGQEAASMRRIAAETGAGVMSLYYYVPSKEDLVELMVDEVIGETRLPERPGADWRASLVAAADEKRALWLRHPWLATAWTHGHPIWGPNSLRQQEFVLGTLAEFDLQVDELLSLIGLYNSYVESFVRNEVGWLEEARRTKMDMTEWMRRSRPYAKQLVATGQYPMFTRVLTETMTPDMKPEARFHYGLDLVLDSIAATLARLA
ncbi:TetR/AcrR family transcriptional regulator [Streptomyces beihaiensis]|uniref:TetR/AcrR family transcriptional regulator n=1 Tax=Streptomyces beihaiensis TaxID=2984495 RepID=A0ABT3U0K0_9ACTN|nr:TetR/AcrR family transcriptional regulator C-terminal domain-containing protein [Streptomyces beihaiensis]MCX3062127.1 TetR/AcrR family transcriptional regulator [Streptomyces beihaiensis]